MSNETRRRMAVKRPKAEGAMGVIEDLRGEVVQAAALVINRTRMVRVAGMVASESAVNIARALAAEGLLRGAGDETERALEDLRDRIEALVRDLDAARADGTIYTYGQVQDWLRALLAGSGERPGQCGHDLNALVDVDEEGHAVCSECEPSLSDRPAPVEHACGNCEGIDPPSCINYPPPALATNRPAPVVPDSPGVLRERVTRALAEASGWSWALLTSPGYDDDALAHYRKLADAVLAVVGQGVTAEQVEYAIDGAIPDDLLGYRDIYTERAARRVLALLRHGDADHPSAVVRSGEQGDE